ncbi:esterase/lipase family protein [Desulfospira joergensenii]|uniref:esterase/lipase family protein n=1 Tax=Desulfospira joergensenii TaxID=53329 RepID=UPI0003B634C4|nr:alpha/beta hydrolase [Desulfospira joergensenii]
MKKLSIRKLGKIFIVILIVFFCVQWGRGFFPDQEKHARTSIQFLVKKIFPAADRKTQKGYGLKVLNRSEQDTEGSDLIILIHGLDEPGMIWMNLAPVLTGKNFRTFEMVYPNDQAISLSSDFFLGELEKLDEKRSVIVIAHSMGGLVTRNMLTRPDLKYSTLVQNGLVPRIKRLIMVGTPNHGSQLARLRIMTEIRDFLHHWLEKDAPFLYFLLDGTGAAAVDLIPGSKFLRELNARPRPRDVDMHIIAARVIPLNQRFFDTIGDILVTVDSTRLKGVPLTLVRGTHLTMIRNLTRSSTRVPPAIPIIMDILEGRL